MAELEFRMSVNGGTDGEIEAIYFQLRAAKVARTDEVIDGALLADYDRQGQLVGFEIISPVKIADIVPFIEKPSRAIFRRFIQRAPDFVLP